MAVASRAGTLRIRRIECGTDIADSLCHQFHVGAVSGIYHTVRHHAGEQRFNRCQNGDEGAGNFLADLGPYNKNRQTDSAYKKRLPVKGADIGTDSFPFSDDDFYGI